MQEHLGWRAGDGSVLCAPLTVPWACRRAFLLTALRRVEWERLANRRADFAAAGRPDLDTKRLGKVALGGTVPQATAAY